MSELGYMHRRVQVEVAWFIALSDAGFAEFKPLSPGARSYLLALVKNGDTIEIDAIKHRLTLDIPAAEMKRRKAKWKKPAPRYRRGVLAKFAASTTSASTGAVTDAGL